MGMYSCPCLASLDPQPTGMSTCPCHPHTIPSQSRWSWCHDRSWRLLRLLRLPFPHIRRKRLGFVETIELLHSGDVSLLVGEGDFVDRFFRVDDAGVVTGC